MELEIIAANGENADFIKLTKLLDEELSKQYGELQKQYDKYNRLDDINDVIIIYEDEIPAACGAIKEYDSDSIELKRIFVKQEFRQRGLSKLVLGELEELGREKGYKYALLETGIKQHEAINLYKNSGYETIQNYGQYEGNGNSICMKKALL